MVLLVQVKTFCLLSIFRNKFLREISSLSAKFRGNVRGCCRRWGTIVQRIPHRPREESVHFRRRIGDQISKWIKFPSWTKSRQLEHSTGRKTLTVSKVSNESTEIRGGSCSIGRDVTIATPELENTV